MKKFIFLCRFIGFGYLKQNGLWLGTALFYVISFYIFGLLLFPIFEKKIFWTFYLLLKNFGIALMLKNNFQEDFYTTRLHTFKHQPVPLEVFILAKILVLTGISFLLHITLLPALGLVFGPLNDVLWIPFIFWQLFSILLLVSFYLLGAAFSLKSYLGEFLNLIIVLPLLIPWFILSFEYLLHGDLSLLIGIAILLLIFVPLIILVISWILRAATVL